jgi:hypothetical protein
MSKLTLMLASKAAMYYIIFKVVKLAAQPHDETN